MDFCTHYPLCAYARVSAHRVLFTRLRCGQWSCEYCALKNRDIWRAHLLDTLPRISDHWWFITLTAHEHLRSATASLKNIRENLDKLFKRLRRIFKHVHYVRVYEKHPTSEARHAHLVACGLSPFIARDVSRTKAITFTPLLERQAHRGTWSIRTWFKKTARECGMGYQVDCQKIDNPGASIGYVTKYLTKSFQDLHEKGLRHVQTSREIGNPKTEVVYSWKVVSFVTARDFLPGDVVCDCQTGEVIDSAYFEEHDFYPIEMM